jgi:hypothetical protein
LGQPDVDAAHDVPPDPSYRHAPRAALVLDDRREQLLAVEAALGNPGQATGVIDVLITQGSAMRSRWSSR